MSEVFGTFSPMDPSKGDLYLGRYLETNDPVIYPSDSLTTHGVIMGGSSPHRGGQG